jgi:hypothetical protein
MMEPSSSHDDAIILVPDEFELSNDGRMIELRLCQDEGADLVWASWQSDFQRTRFATALIATAMMVVPKTNERIACLRTMWRIRF